jgi:hypothetical protein
MNSFSESREKTNRNNVARAIHDGVESRKSVSFLVFDFDGNSVFKGNQKGRMKRKRDVGEGDASWTANDWWASNRLEERGRRGESRSDLHDGFGFCEYIRFLRKPKRRDIFRWKERTLRREEQEAIERCVNTTWVMIIEVIEAKIDKYSRIARRISPKVVGVDISSMWPSNKVKEIR